MGIIFDLDQTLIDSSIAENLRKQRQWDKVYSLIPNFKLYDGMEQLLQLFHKNNITISFVTSSPKVYCLKVLSYFDIKFHSVVGYHDTLLKKPHPDPIKLAVKQMSCSSSSVYSFGDRVIDIEASNQAGVISVACLWGSNESFLLKKANPKLIFNTTFEAVTYFENILHT